MAKKSYKPDTFEWVCNNCNYVHIEKLRSTKPENESVERTCSQCGTIRQIKLVELPEAGLAGDWLDSKCRQCEERKDCLSKDNKKIFYARLKLINKLGFCEDYVFDHSQIEIDKRQVCHEERTFDDIFNKGQMPIYGDEEI